MTEEEAAAAVQKHLQKVMARYVGKITPAQVSEAQSFIAKSLNELRDMGLLPPVISIEESEHIPGMFKISFSMTNLMLDNILWNRQMIDGISAQEMMAELAHTWDIIGGDSWDKYVLIASVDGRDMVVRRPSMLTGIFMVMGEEATDT